MDIQEKAKELSESYDDREIEQLIAELVKTKKNYVPWKEGNEVLEKWEIPAKNWFKLYLAKNISTDKKYLRLFRGRQTLSIKTNDELLGTLSALKKGAAKLGWYKSEEVDMLTKLDDYKNVNQADQEKIRNLRKALRDLQTHSIKIDIPKFEKALEEFKKIYTSKHDEKDLQKILEENTWMFGDEYIDQDPISFSQVSIWDSKYDFFLQRYDGFYDIFEIKKLMQD